MSRTYKDRYSHKQRINKIKIRKSNLISNKIINSKKQRKHDSFSFKFVYFLLDKFLKEGKTHDEFVLEIDSLFKHMPMAYKVKVKKCLHHVLFPDYIIMKDGTLLPWRDAKYYIG